MNKDTESEELYGVGYSGASVGAIGVCGIYFGVNDVDFRWLMVVYAGYASLLFVRNIRIVFCANRLFATLFITFALLNGLVPKLMTIQESSNLLVMLAPVVGLIGMLGAFGSERFFVRKERLERMGYIVKD